MYSRYGKWEIYPQKYIYFSLKARDVLFARDARDVKSNAEEDHDRVEERRLFLFCFNSHYKSVACSSTLSSSRLYFFFIAWPLQSCDCFG